MWTTLRWNCGNTSAIVAFCLLPIITFGDGNLNDRQSVDIRPISELQSDNFGMHKVMTVTPPNISMASNADNRPLSTDSALVN